jgi:hypothetical protein
MHYLDRNPDFKISEFQNPGLINSRVELTKFRRDDKYKQNIIN